MKLQGDYLFQAWVDEVKVGLVQGKFSWSRKPRQEPGAEAGADRARPGGGGAGRLAGAARVVSRL